MAWQLGAWFHRTFKDQTFVFIGRYLQPVTG